jgi:hypothetical protein
MKRHVISGLVVGWRTPDDKREWIHGFYEVFMNSLRCPEAGYVHTPLQL